MRPPKRRSPAPHRQAARLALWLLFGLLSAQPILFSGCAGGTSSVGRFFGSRAEPPRSEASVATPAESATSSPTPTPVAGQARGHKKSANEAHIAVEKASQASESAAQASEKALQASKQARQAANAASQVEGEGAGKNVVSLEANPVASLAGTPGAAFAAGASGSTPAAHAKGTPGLESASVATASLPAIGSSSGPDPANAAKLIDEVDKIEKRIDRNDLSADETARDVLAQRLLQDAKKALADRDNVAATSLASKASTLLDPLPKIAGTSTNSMR